MVVQAGSKAESCLTATTLERPGVPVYSIVLFKVVHTAEDLIAGVAHVTVKLVVRMLLQEVWPQLASHIQALQANGTATSQLRTRCFTTSISIPLFCMH